MRVVVYPHTMEVGGSQLNALEIAAAVRERGHEVLLYAPEGDLLAHAHSLGLEHVPALRAPFHPSPTVTRDLARLVHDRGIDVLHGYEWPPALEAFGVRALRPHVAAVATVMSMAIPPFLPSSMPLVVGTRRLAEQARRSRRGPVRLLEPPVDTHANRPGVAADRFRADHPVEPGTAQVVVVSRLAHELKLEGILTAVRAVATLARGRAVRLVVVGDGPAAPEVRAAAEEVNRAAGREVVLLTGQLDDPRGAYDAADVCLGMGGSALRALAFARPLVVQGERGFFELLTPESVGTFLEQGWYGVADRAPEEAVEHLAALLVGLLDDPGRRERLGCYGRELVEERFGLGRAAELQIEVYREAVEARAGVARTLAEGARSTTAVVRHKARRRVQRSRGDVARDDFNAKPA
ncbi:glycosyltransferase family 4 protein [Geodermatophilus nigrescens]|uniref:Glycosyltransferase involved in cell wall bisynthesis n=1 Tax=Geodermatophilus nigrescens TaxID=1070870 RepID=A0A1M5E4T1_9ACTN|nr:glycosyltransferase [Geodermatophilus nigrescens]SHF74205.1 Glycosyltransferase involved in cell wall bisynthesis [Geodermatophilus nigrescens]